MEKVRNMLNPLKPETIKEIEFILNGIVEGRLEHVQDTYHCGTAHCVAGWHQVLKYEKLGFSFLEHNPVYTIFKNADNRIMFVDVNPWTEACVDWELTDNEGLFLLHAYACLDSQTKLLEWFKQGRRIYGAADSRSSIEYSIDKEVSLRNSISRSRTPEEDYNYKNNLEFFAFIRET